MSGLLLREKLRGAAELNSSGTFWDDAAAERERTPKKEAVGQLAKKASREHGRLSFGEGESCRRLLR